MVQDRVSVLIKDVADAITSERLAKAVILGVNNSKSGRKLYYEQLE